MSENERSDSAHNGWTSATKRRSNVDGQGGTDKPCYVYCPENGTPAGLLFNQKKGNATNCGIFGQKNNSSTDLP